MSSTRKRRFPGRIRKPMEKIVLELFDAINRLRISTISGLTRDTKINSKTIERYMTVIIDIQNKPKVRVIRNPSGEMIYGLERELETLLPKESTKKSE